jgi:hypothetical protein
VRKIAMTDQDLIDLLNRGYACPPDAGPAWRAAHEAGIDMSLIEDALAMSYEERLEDHQMALNQLLQLQASLEHGPG